MRALTTRLAVLAASAVLGGCGLAADVDSGLIPEGGAGGGGAGGGGAGGGGAGGGGAGAMGGSGGAGAMGGAGATGGSGAMGGGGSNGCDNGVKDGDETATDCGGPECAPCGNGSTCAAPTDCESQRCDITTDPDTCAACLSNDDCDDSGAAWECVAGVCTDSGPKDDGESCVSGGDCESTNCVDGVCCDTACGGGALDDCMACSKAAGAPSDGTCGPLVSGTACGDDTASDCDLADSCDGAGSCATNVLAAGTPCTTDALFCTGVEECDGAGSCGSPGTPCADTELCDETAATCSVNIWFNEIHYDNADPDADEGIELAGAAGVSVVGWGFFFYDGGSGTAFAAVGPLGEAIADESNGFGTLGYPLAGMPEGNIGIALVDETFSVVQFISYGGSFTAVDGPAAGLDSTDVGLVEDENTAAGMSLQLTGGPGGQYSDFTWTSAANSLGAVNAGQTF